MECRDRRRKRRARDRKRICRDRKKRGARDRKGWACTWMYQQVYGGSKYAMQVGRREYAGMGWVEIMEWTDAMECRDRMRGRRGCEKGTLGFNRLIVDV
eukprot:1339662-Amorphochlora_amoeboformis.AAC.3